MRADPGSGIKQSVAVGFMTEGEGLSMEKFRFVLSAFRLEFIIQRSA
jgi:hypothetical protein